MESDVGRRRRLTRKTAATELFSADKPRTLAGEHHYGILGLQRSATKDEVSRAYKSKALQWHPDRRGGDTVMMQQISLAYETLSDPSKRSAYDLQCDLEGCSDGLCAPAETRKRGAQDRETFWHDSLVIARLAIERARQSRDLNLKSVTLSQLHASKRILNGDETRSTQKACIDNPSPASAVLKGFSWIVRRQGKANYEVSTEIRDVSPHIIEIYTSGTRSLDQAIDWQVALTELRGLDVSAMNQQFEAALEQVYKKAPCIRLSFRTRSGGRPSSRSTGNPVLALKFQARLAAHGNPCATLAAQLRPEFDKQIEVEKQEWLGLCARFLTSIEEEIFRRTIDVDFRQQRSRTAGSSFLPGQRLQIALQLDDDGANRLALNFCKLTPAEKRTRVTALQAPPPTKALRNSDANTVKTARRAASHVEVLLAKRSEEAWARALPLGLSDWTLTFVGLRDALRLQACSSATLACSEKVLQTRCKNLLVDVGAMFGSRFSASGRAVRPPLNARRLENACLFERLLRTRIVRYIQHLDVSMVSSKVLEGKSLNTMSCLKHVVLPRELGRRPCSMGLPRGVSQEFR